MSILKPESFANGHNEVDPLSMQQFQVCIEAQIDKRLCQHEEFMRHFFENLNQRLESTVEFRPQKANVLSNSFDQPNNTPQDQQFRHQHEEMQQLFEDLGQRMQAAVIQEIRARFSMEVSTDKSCDLFEARRQSIESANGSLKSLIKSKSRENVRKEIKSLLEMVHEYDTRAHNKVGMGTARGKMCFSPPQKLGTIVESQAFERCVTFVILLNAIFMVASADYAVTNPGQASPRIFQVSEIIFTCFYFLELALKLWSFRCGFFMGSDRLVNIVDFGIVLVSIIDLGVHYFGLSSTVLNVQLLRLLRLLRVTRIFRTFSANPAFQELRTMMLSITSSLRTLLWCVALLALLSFVFALVFMNATATYLENPARDPMIEEKLLEHWGSLPAAMVSLLSAVTGGNDWRVYQEPLYDVGMLYPWIFLTYIGFNLLCVLNIVMAVYVDSAMSARLADHEGNLMRELDDVLSRDDVFSRMYYVLGKEMDEDRSGTISRQEFVERLQSPVVRAYFTVCGMNILDSDDFYERLVRVTGQKELDLNTFVEGCMHLRAPGMDPGMHTSFTELRLGQKALKSQVSHMEALLHKVTERSSNQPEGLLGGRFLIKASI